MEQDTIRTIREAEQAAEQTEQEAVRQGEAAIAGARADADAESKERIAKARAQAAAALAVAHAEGAEMQRVALDAVRQEVAALREGAAARADEVRRLILSELV